MSSNYKVISKHWATLSKCQYSFKHWQPDFSEEGKCIFIIKVVFQSSGTGNKCFNLRWIIVLLYVIIYFATLKLVTYFPQFNLLSHKKWLIDKWMFGRRELLQNCNSEITQLEKTFLNEHTVRYLLKSCFWPCTQMAFRSSLVFHLSLC